MPISCFFLLSLNSYTEKLTSLIFIKFYFGHQNDFFGTKSSDVTSASWFKKTLCVPPVFRTFCKGCYLFCPGPPRRS